MKIHLLLKRKIEKCNYIQPLGFLTRLKFNAIKGGKMTAEEALANLERQKALILGATQA